MSGNRGAEHKQVTAARRIVILQAVRLCKPVTTQAIFELVHGWHQSGSGPAWPQATWRDAVSNPYYAGIYQHLRALEKQGYVEWDDDRGWALKAPVAQLRHRAADVLRLRSEGKTLEETAELLSISRSLAGSLSSDPTGERERERKRAYCSGCGAKKQSEAAVVCPGCLRRKAAGLLPPETFTTYIEQARGAGYELVFGVTPDFRRVLRFRSEAGRRIHEREVRSDLSWSDAVGELSEELGVALGL